MSETVQRAELRWWPFVAAVGVAALMWGVEVEPAGRLLIVLPLIYLTLAVVGRRGWSWPVLAGRAVGARRRGGARRAAPARRRAAA